MSNEVLENMEQEQEQKTQQEEQKQPEKPEQAEEPEQQQEQTEEPEQAEETEEQPEPDNSKEYNFKVLREKSQNLERENQELKQYLNHFLEQQQSKTNAPKQQQQEPEEDLNFDVKDDDLVEGRHIKKFKKYISNIENKLKKYQQESYAQQVELQLSSKYPDFNQVLTSDNIQKLKREHPYMAQVLLDSKDLKSQGEAAYHAIKRFGIIDNPEVSRAKKKIKQVSKAPKSVNSARPQQGDSPLSKANEYRKSRLTEQDRKRIWQEMQNYIK